MPARPRAEIGPEALKARVVARALEEGFVACRICRPDDVPEMPERLARFVEAGFHGQMGWMEDRMHWRGNPAALWPEARSVIMLAESYTPEHDPARYWNIPTRGRSQSMRRGVTTTISSRNG